MSDAVSSATRKTHWLASFCSSVSIDSHVVTRSENRCQRDQKIKKRPGHVAAGRRPPKTFWFRWRENGNVASGLTKAFDPHFYRGRERISGGCEDAACCSRVAHPSSADRLQRGARAGGGTEGWTYLYSGSSESKSTHSTPTSSRQSGSSRGIESRTK